MLKTNRLLTLFAILFMALGSYSQNKTIDSLQKDLNKHLQKDTIRVNLLNAIAEKIYSTNPSKAIQVLTESQKLATSLNYNQGKMDSFLQLGKLFNKTGNYEKAKHYATEGTIIANKTNNKKYKKAFFLLLSESYYDKSKSKNDSIIAEEVRDVAAAIKYKYYLKDSLDKSTVKIDDLNETVQLKDSELVISKLINLIWLLGIIIVSLLFAYIYSRLKSRKIKLENSQLLTEQKLKRSQMNPHFIANSLQNIRSLIAQDQKEEAIDYLNQFAVLTRQILESSEENYSSITDELEWIESYIQLQKKLYNNSFDYQFDIDTAIDQDSLFIPQMLMQPAIENAIKHGILSNDQKGLLTVKLYFINKTLLFEVTDTGKGIANSKASNHQSLSMKITKERLQKFLKKQTIIFEITNLYHNNQIVGAQSKYEIPYIYEN